MNYTWLKYSYYENVKDIWRVNLWIDWVTKFETIIVVVCGNDGIAIRRTLILVMKCGTYIYQDSSTPTTIAEIWFIQMQILSR